MVSRNLERANENDGFKMTALECTLRVQEHDQDPTPKGERDLLTKFGNSV